MTLRPAPLVCWLLAFCAGCGALLDGPPENRCAADSECGSGTCDLERAMCIAEPAEPMRVAIEVVPPTHANGGSPLPVQFDPFEVTGPLEREFELPRGVSVRGLVRNDEGLGVAVSASITFTLPSSIPGGAPTRIETRTFAEPMRDGSGEPYDFEVQLLPGRIYEVTVQPTGEWRGELPPLRRMLASPPPDTRIPTQPFYWEGLQSVRGVLLDTSGAGQPGLIIRAIEQSSGRVVSSTYTTGSDPSRPPGWFEIVRAPSEGWYFSINASASRIAEGAPSPTLAVASNVLIPGPDGAVTLEVPTTLGVITYSGFVEQEGTSGRGTAAALTFSTTDVLDEVTQVVGSFRTTVTTSEEPGHEGEFTVQLLPGTYDVVITPTDPNLSIVRETVRLDPEHGSDVLGQIFAVPMRARYGGHVRTFDEEPMINAQVRGQARGSTHDGLLADVAVYARSSEALTDPDGQFNLPLDIGLYDVIVEPPSGTSWPWAIQRDVAIGGVEAVLTRDIELSAPVPLAGRAQFTGGAPVANGEIRAYALVEEPGGSTRAVQIGRAQTDVEGRFTLLLPSSL